MKKKQRRVRELLVEMGSVLVAYSGGVDSSLLLHEAVTTLGRDRVLAVHGVSAIRPEEERREAVRLARSLGARLQLLPTNEMKNPNFTANTPERCYHCKAGLLKKLEEIRRREGLGSIIDGTNSDDANDIRPGERAKKGYPVSAPLAEAGLTKGEIRLLAKITGLPVWDKPAQACLATRIPFGERITKKRLARVGAAERLLHEAGFRQVRVRDHDPICRIELLPGDFPRFLRRRAEFAGQLHKLGFRSVALDLDGFRSGSMNALLPKR